MRQTKRKPTKPSVWPPKIAEWARGDGSWLWDAEERPHQPFGLQFLVSEKPFRRRVWGASSTECINKRNAVRAQVALTIEERQRVANGATTVMEMMGNWRSYIGKGKGRRKDGGDLAPQTLELYDRAIEFIGNSQLAQREARSINRGDIRKFQTWLMNLDNPQGHSSVRGIRICLGMAFKMALDDGYVIANPTLGIDLPGDIEQPKEKMPLDDVEFDRMRTYLAADPTLQNVALLTILMTGVRGGEVLALRWQDSVDLDAGTVTIQRGVQRSNGGRTRTVGPTLKTKSSRRTIGLTKDVVDALRVLYRDRPFGFVFADPSKSEDVPLRAESLRWHLRKACKALGIDRRCPHELRHSNASKLLDVGEPLPMVAKHLGHNSINTVPVYAHPMRALIDVGSVLGDGTAVG